MHKKRQMIRCVISALIVAGFVGCLILAPIFIGPNPFTGNQPAVFPSVALNEGQQIAAAWNEYLKDHNNNPPTTSANLIEPDRYLTQILLLPATDLTDTHEMVISKNNGHYFAYADMGAPRRKSVAGTAADSNAYYCNRIIKTAIFGSGQTDNGIMTTAAPGTIYNSNGATTPASGNGTFGCAYTNASTGNTVGGMAIPAGHYVMEYLIQ